MREETPNDPKLSDGRSRHRLCGKVAGGEGGGSIDCDCGACSLERMVRPLRSNLDYSLITVRSGPNGAFLVFWRDKEPVIEIELSRDVGQAIAVQTGEWLMQAHPQFLFPGSFHSKVDK